MLERLSILLLVLLLAMFASVATTEERAGAADVAQPVEGENFDVKPTGTSVVTNTTLYLAPNGQALKFTNNTAIATENRVDFGSQGDVVLVARGGQSGGSPTLSVNVDGGAFSAAQTISNSGAPVAYTYDLNVSAGPHTIGVKAANTATGRYPFLDFVTFPASGSSSGGTDTTPPETTITSGPSGSVTGTTATFGFTSTELGSTFQCRLVGQDSTRTNCTSPKTYSGLTAGTTYTFKVWATDAAGNIDTTPATRTLTPSGGSGGTDTDGDGVPDSTDQCATQPGPASNNGCPLPTPDPSLTYIGSATGNTGTTPQVKVTVPVPPGTEQGDFMLALLQADYGNVGGTLPSGWTLINEHLEGRDLSLHAYYRIAAATEPRSYTWNVVNAALHPLAGGTILTFRGVDQASPVFANAVNPETADPAKIDCPSVNAPNGGILVCGFTHDDPQPDINVPASMTRISNFIIRNDDAHAVAYEPIAKAGATGLRSATINPDLKGGGNDISMAISLRPSAVNSP